MQFLLDVNMPPSLGIYLSTLGHSYRCVNAFMDAKSSDLQILQEAVRKNEIILTHDNDFGTLLAFLGQDRPSVILFRIHKINAERFFILLTNNWSRIEQSLQEGAFIVFEEDKFRIRTLPIKR